MNKPAFELLEPTSATLAHVNPRDEKMGKKDRRAACDLRIRVKTNGGILAFFSPDLRASLYREHDKTEGDMVDQVVEGPTKLKFPEMDAINWRMELLGATFTVVRGASQKSHIVLADSKINKFGLHAQEGGTIDLTFRVQCHPDDKGYGWLCMNIGQKIDILVEPEEEKQAALPV